MEQENKQDRIYIKKHSDIRWDFSDDNRPYITLETGNNWPSTQFVDPFPCYTHNEQLVRAEIAYVEKTLPIKYPPKWFILPYDTPSRTNGTAYDHKDYDDGKTTPSPYIVLAGKRIIVMPAMTRYLVAHEYMHCVIYNLEHILDDKDKKLKKEFCEIYGIEESREYGALKWHLNVTEIMDNSGRVLLLNREPDFWPHDCKHPSEIRNLKDWWAEKIKLLV